jgi:Ca2+-transporting ATPase
MTVVGVSTASRHFVATGVGYNPHEGVFQSDKGEPLTSEEAAVLRATLEGTALCNDSGLSQDDTSGKVVYTPVGAPTEVALLTGAIKAGIDLGTLRTSCPRIGAVPFESEHKVGSPGRD